MKFSMATPLAVILLALSLSACGEKPVDQNTTPAAGVTSVPASEVSASAPASGVAQ
ncbi:hypothetical protein LVJ83_12580 [Uruburuella testudinis]|uniref:Lipoprotein n=1 Tax=Uruburuella testudinis TaxID=1282863 RepID=A0ABY4DRS6_9NEIS|nr:hypothetical protein [Uruburuella testudinis]UOO81736.1 hypothetical protein LVJ83_12580 [Uruburuella testudinis]